MNALGLVAEHSKDIHETYLHSGFGPAMAKFIARVSHAGPLPADYGSLPGGHAGFLGGEYGQVGKPDEFAATLRRVLAAEA